MALLAGALLAGALLAGALLAGALLTGALLAGALLMATTLALMATPLALLAPPLMATITWSACSACFASFLAIDSCCLRCVIFLSSPSKATHSL